MKKLLQIIFIYLLITSCGYSPIYSSKNSNFYLEKILKKENNVLNNKLVKNLKIISNTKSQNNLKLEIDTKKNINITANDKAGNPSRYEMNIVVNIIIILSNNQEVQKTFSSSFGYSNDTNKFNLSQYEKEIEEILINKIIEDCIIYLSSI